MVKLRSEKDCCYTQITVHPSADGDRRPEKSRGNILMILTFYYKIDSSDIFNN